MIVCMLQLTSDQLFDVYKGFIDKYPVVSIEDAFDQDDWAAWTKMNEAVSIQLVGSVFLHYFYSLPVSLYLQCLGL